MTNLPEYIYNEGLDWENIEVTIPIASDVIFYMDLTGTENDSTFYLHTLDHHGRAFIVVSDQNIQLLTMGNKTFRSPIKLLKGVNHSFVRRVPRFNKLIFRTDTANTNIRLLVI